MRRGTNVLVLAAVLLGAAAAQAQYPGVERGSFYSATNRRNIPYNIYLPPGYHQGEDRYPVVYWFHGLLQDQNWGLRVTTYLHNAVTAGELPPMILVLGTDGQGATSRYKDAPALGVYGEQAVLELVAHVDANFRTVARREARAFEGFSMGGLCAMYFACKHPELFCSAVATGGALGDWELAVWATWSAEFLRENTAIHLVASTGNAITLPQNWAFSRHLTALGVPHGYQQLPGAIHTITSYYQRLGASTMAFHAANFYGR